MKQLDGTGAAVRLTNNDADNYDPAFSPDGTQVTYRSELEGGGIYAIPSLGGEPHLLVPQGKRPRFSPDGRFLLYWKGIGSRGRPFGEFGVSLFVQAVLGGTPIQIGSSCTWINALALWSPDSRRVLFEGLCDQQLDMWIFSIDDKHLQPSHALFKYLLDNAFRSPASAYQYPAFVFQEWVPDPPRLFMLRFTGDTISSEAVPISADASRVTGRLQKLTFGTDDESRMSVASNGRVVLSSFAATPQVWALPIDDEARSAGDPQQLTFDGSGAPSLSRGGQIVAVRSSRAEAWELHSINLVTRKQTVIATGPGGIGSHLLSRPGDTIFYVVMHDQKFRLFQASISGGLPRELREGRFLLGDVSSSGRVLLGTPDRNRHGIDAFDIQSREEREVMVDPGGRWLWAGSLSNDDRWLTFTAVWPGHSQIYVAPFRGVLVPPSEWIPITDGSTLDDHPRFSHQEKFLFFASDRDGSRCIWAERLSLDMHPLGQPFPVQHFHTSRRDIARRDFGLCVGPKMMVLDEAELTGNLWLLEPASKQ
ncbi:MAG: PD40 domain-containing protein [Acidobacteriaceae bacterium]|nr:PD40 domain-containing protein [Acidobacteriaceae bacterium]